jgi:hypothetical protein
MKAPSLLRTICTITFLIFNSSQSYSLSTFKNAPKRNLHDLEKNSDAYAHSDDCCDATKHKKDCTTQKICSIISKLNVVKSQIATIDSNIDAGFSTVQAELDEIAEIQVEQLSQLDGIAQTQAVQTVLLEEIADAVAEQSSALDGCCATLVSQINTLTTIVNTGFDDTSLQLQAAIGEIDSCCETLNSKIDAIVVGSCDLTSVDSRLDSLSLEVEECCLTLNSKLDGLTAGITVVATCDISTVSSKIDLCCETLNSKLDALAAGISAIALCDISTVSSKIDLCCETLNSKIDELDFGVNSRIEQCCTILSNEINLTNVCCFEVNSKLDSIISRTGGGGSSCVCTFTCSCNCGGGSNLCAPTVITSSTTINSSGNYCLAQDLFSTNAETILINTSNVVLDLNSHNVDNASTTTNQAAIRVNPFHNNIVITNGSVKHNGGSNGLGMGIHLDGATIINLSKISVGGAPGGNFGWATGIQSSSSRVTMTDSSITLNFVGLNSTLGVLRLESCNFQGSQGDGAMIQQGPVFIKDCFFSQAGQSVTSSGLHLFGANTVAVHDSQFNGNITMMSSGVLIEQSSNVSFYNCISSSNGLYGFSLGSPLQLATDVFLFNCYACENAQFGSGVGFNVTAARNCSLINCVAKNNNVGFFVADDFLATQGIIRGCTSNGNASIGFSNSSATTSYYSNVACNNAVNYSGVVVAQVTSPMNAKAFENVDCSNTTPDIAESKLDACCFATQSKLDLLLS